MTQDLQQGPSRQSKKLLGVIPLPQRKERTPKPMKAPATAPIPAGAQEDTFYERAIEWTHRADKVINLFLGYALAIASVLGFMDVLSNGEVLSHVPVLFYVWLGIMGLGVDFQILLVIGRVPDLARQVNGVSKYVFLGFNFAFLAFLCYMSAIIGAVFTQHRDIIHSTITSAMGTLGINATYFVYERAALATLLLVLMAVDRTMERWRMQIQREQHPVPTSPAVEEAGVSSAPQAPSAAAMPSDLEKLLHAMQAMNAQNLQAMQAMTQHSLQVTVEQFTRVTVEAVRETVAALPGYTALSLPAAPQNPDVLDPTQKPERGKQEGNKIVEYGPSIEALYLDNPAITTTEVERRLGCTRKTAAKHLQRLKPLGATVDAEREED